MKNMKDYCFLFRSRRYSRFVVITALLANNLLSWLIAARHWQPGLFSLYVDPGSGLLMWQLLAATAAGFVFNVRNQIARFVKKLWPGEDA